MAYILLAIGAALAYLDYLGSQNLTAAGSLLKEELFTGTQPFYKWAGAIVIIAALGYIPDLQEIAEMFLILILLVIILKNSSGFAALIRGV